MPRTGLRPHVWKVQGEIPHEQYCCWLKMKAQANFRGEEWQLLFEDYQAVWQGKWDQKGRDIMSYCLTRIDGEGAWHKDNILCIPRHEHFKRSGQAKKDKQRWQQLELMTKS